MIRCLALLFVGLSIAAPSARAQVSVDLDLPTANVILYESVPAVVSIRNLTNRPLTLRNANNGWLSFTITDPDRRIVAPAGGVNVGESLTIGPGQTVRKHFDLVHAYDLRAPGTYRVRAVVKTDTIRAESEPDRLVILAGTVIWNETVGVADADGESDQQRTYSLVIKRDPNHYQIFARIIDNDKAIVYAMIPMGIFVPMGDPSTAIDRQTNLHVLFRSGSRAFQYREISPQGKVLDAAAYSDMQSNPQLLVQTNGNVSVKGGEKIFPRAPQQERAAPVVVPKPEPPKKRWWQFWKKSPAAAADKRP